MNTQLPKTKVETEIAGVQRIDLELSTGFQKTMTTEIQVIVDGKEVVNKEGHSLVGNFLALLMSSMRGSYNANYSNTGYYDWQALSTGGTTNSTSTNDLDLCGPPEILGGPYEQIDFPNGFWEITGVTNGTTARVTVDGVNYTNLSSGHSNKIYKIWDVGGTTSVNGVFFGSYVTTNQFDLYHDEALTVPVDTSGDGTYVSGSGYLAICGTGRWTEGGNSFANVLMKVGTGTTPVALHDWNLDEPIPDGTATGCLDRQGFASVSAEAINEINGTGEITFTEDYVNNSGGTVTIEEIGLFVRPNNTITVTTWSSDTYFYILIARDLQQIVVPNGSTATINYKIKTTLETDGGTDGGWLQQFHKHMYSLFSGVTRVVQNIFNVDTNSSRNPSALRVAGYSGGHAASAATGVKYHGELHGIAVGSGNTAVDITNYEVETRITHGRASGRLMYGGTLVQDWKKITTRVFTVSGSAGTLSITIDNTAYTQAYATSADATAAAWVSTHAATLAALSPVITATDTGTAEITLTVDGHRRIVVSDTSSGGMSFTEGTESGTASYKVERWLYNQSGASVAINEVALRTMIGFTGTFDSNFDKSMAVTRHVLGSTVNVPDGDMVVVTITFSLTV